MEKIIRNAKESDTAGLKKLWAECFPQDTEYAEFFFGKVFRTECARVCEIDGELAAMLHSFPYDFMTPSGVLNAKYIYGVGTAVKFRGKGIAGELLDGEAHGCDFTIIIPQSESLFEFYERNSFTELFYVERKLADGQVCEFKNAGYDDIEALDAMYEDMCRDRIHPVRSRAYWETLMSEFEFLGGGIALFDGGYCAYYKNNGKYEISELCPPSGVAPFGYSCPAVTVGDGARIGAARLISERAKEYFAKTCTRYMNLMHN